MPRPKSVAEAASLEIKKNFNLDAFKNKKGLSSNVKFKDQKWIPFSEALQDILSIEGIPVGHISLLRGHSDTGKSTTLAEAAVAAQKMGILPVFIITEMKFSWDFFKKIGFELNEIADKDSGEIINYDGFFIYADRGTLNTIEDKAAFIADLLDEQKKGNLPFDMLFLVDSIGSIPSKMSLDANKNNPMWNAGAYSQQFGNFINQKITLSRKENYPYTNTMLCVNKVWVAPAENPMAQPKMKNKGGDTMFYDASLVLTYGNISNSGTSKLNATKDGKTVEFAKRTKVACDKNHVTGIATKGTVVMTTHGFIKDDPKEIEKYKKSHKNEWLNVLGTEDFDVIEDNSEWNEDNKNIPILGEE